jgi:lipid A 3-O-deacylase
MHYTAHYMEHHAAPKRTHVLPKSLIALSAAAAFMAGSASAAEPQGLGVYIEGGISAKSDGADTSTATIGLRVPTTVTFWGERLSLAVDVYVSQWERDAAGTGRRSYTQVGVVPMLRYRFDSGQSPWFVDGGIGVSYLDGKYQRGSQAFSTQWNFSDHLGVGRNFGADRRHELGVYVKHVSNASIKKPNPGETFYQLRYGYRF